MLIMALESATRGCSVALWKNGTVLASRCQDINYSQAEMLVPTVQATLDDAGLSFADIDIFAVTVGPGSFTGVRVGLATARGFSLAAMRPVVGVTTTEVVAYAFGMQRAYEERPVVVVLDAYGTGIYIQAFLLTATPPVPLTPVQTLMPADIADFLANLPQSVVITGDCVSKLDRYLPVDTTVVNGQHPQAWAVAAVAASRAGTGNQMAVEPLYLRSPAVTQQRL